MNLKKALHHEGHRDHEDISCSRMILRDLQQGEARFWNNQLLFFATFVFFVVKLRNIV